MASVKAVLGVFSVCGDTWQNMSGYLAKYVEILGQVCWDGVLPIWTRLVGVLLFSLYIYVWRGCIRWGVRLLRGALCRGDVLRDGRHWRLERLR